MDITFDMITGFGLGIEFVQADEDDGFDQHAIVFDVACFRTILWIDTGESK